MIEQLVVKDYILFEKATVNFTDGMSVITGETGAGKSLLIDAIGYLCGNRINSNIVRQGKDKCVLTMILSCDEKIKEYLEENDFDMDEDQIIISRTITSNQKSTIRINQQITTLSFVKKLISKMVDVHSQMDTYQLMDTKVQLDLLDQYAKNWDLKNKVENAYSLYHKSVLKLKECKEETYSDDELEYATAQYNKIEEINVQKGELEDLQEQIKKYTNSQKTIDLLNSSIYSLEKEDGILDSLYILTRNLSKDDLTSSQSEVLEECYQTINDINEQLKEKRSDFEQGFDLDTLQEREYTIRSLMRRHGGSYESLMQAKQNYLDKIDKILHRQDVIEKCEKEVQVNKINYLKYAKELSKRRQSVFIELRDKIENHCHDLMLEKAQFKVQREEKDISKDGIDQIEFMVSMNPGQPFSPLKTSASGGELSRLMLALKVVFQAENGIDTIIFDEIDTGVSGKVAFAMGNKMHTLSKQYQVLCITHLASVACWAENHYCVSKATVDDVTVTKVKELNEDDSLKELSVMSTGEASEAGLLAAKELKERVKKEWGE